MSHYRAELHWQRDDGARFTDQRYSRRHVWRFDGGVELPASSSPQVVPLPMSDASAVDPEEAFVAALSSCHLLWFLSLAAAEGHVVETYDDAAVGRMGRNAEGRMAMLEVRLHPRVRFAAGTAPDAAALARLHERAHGECFLAASVRCPVLVEPVAAD